MDIYKLQLRVSRHTNKNKLTKHQSLLVGLNIYVWPWDHWKQGTSTQVVSPESAYTSTSIF